MAPDLKIYFLFFQDIDCMPLNPLENMPDALKKHNLASDRFFEGLKERKPYDYLKEWKNSGLVASNENMDTTNGHGHCSTSDYPMNTLMKHAKVSYLYFTISF